MQGLAGGAGSKCAVIYEIVHENRHGVAKQAAWFSPLDVLLFHIAANYANLQCTFVHMYNILVVFVAHICRI